MDTPSKSLTTRETFFANSLWRCDVFVADAWVENDGIEYYFSAETMTQAEAQTCCQYAGGNLVSITSDEQNAYIQGV